MEMNSTNLLWFLAFILLAGGNGFGNMFGGNHGPINVVPPATPTDVNNAINTQSIQNSLDRISAETLNNNYQTAMLLNQQTSQFLQQNNTNQINTLQGFNSIVNQLQNQTTTLGQQISQLGYQLDNCCCSIKTQLLQDRLADKTSEALALQNKLDNAQQTQTILGNLGRFVAWAGSGTQTASAIG